MVQRCAGKAKAAGPAPMSRLVGFRGDYTANEDTNCLKGSMFTFLVVSDSGAQSMIKVTDRAKFNNIRYK